MTSREPNLWVMVQERLRRILDEHSYKNWFSHIRFASCENGCLELEVPSQFFADWLRDHYLEAISASVRPLVPDFREVRFLPMPETPHRPDGGGSASDDALPRTATPAKPLRALPRFDGFNARYTFDRFVVGAGNRFAHAAAKAVAETPARAYNPLFLYGGTGLGKTHLMQAIGQEILQRQPDVKVEFISTEQFTNQLIESIARKATARFRTKYRKVDILLVDDIHFISGKEATQEEFFHTFNALFDMHKQIVISSDRQPKEIEGVEGRLISRFEWGLVTDIQPPDFETRVAILQNKAARESLTVPPDVIEHIATYVSTNIRELEGALITVLAYSKLTEHKITLKMAEEVLRDLIGRDKIKQITIEHVQRAVAEFFDVRISDLRGRSRRRQVAFPRQISMFLCKEMIPGLSLGEIGEAFGGKDHTTVLYSCQKVTQESRQNAELLQLVTQLEKAIRS